jgi:hypothetical protein
MMVFIDYISAIRRLHSVNKHVELLREDKYSDRGIPDQILMQRDFIEKEMEYYREESFKWCLILGALAVIALFVYGIFFGRNAIVH